jgi:hypothetical protein
MNTMQGTAFPEKGLIGRERALYVFWSRRNVARVYPHSSRLLDLASGPLWSSWQDSERCHRSEGVRLGPRQRRLRQRPLPRDHRRQHRLPLLIPPVPAADGHRGQQPL